MPAVVVSAVPVLASPPSSESHETGHGGEFGEIDFDRLGLPTPGEYALLKRLHERRFDVLSGPQLGMACSISRLGLIRARSNSTHYAVMAITDAGDRFCEAMESAVRS